MNSQQQNNDILTTITMDKSIAGRIELAKSITEAYECGALWELKAMDLEHISNMARELRNKTFRTHVDCALIDIFDREIALKSNIN